MPSPKEQYQQQLRDHVLKSDPAQERVVDIIQSLYEQLQASLTPQIDERSITRLFTNFFYKKAAQQPIHGLYLWGGVGRGKTHLCDMFYNSVNTQKKIRLHYHRFMILVQQELWELGNVSDPVDKVAAGWAKKYKLLVLDEMHIIDITNALLMKYLLKGLFERGVVLVTTSNSPPDNLYYDGLQRQAFLPAIALLKKFTRVVELGGGYDYRLRLLEKTQTYLTPLGDKTDSLLLGCFHDMAGHDDAQVKTGVAIINEREIPIVKRAAGVIWFEFDAICNSPRSSRDYIEITSFYHTVIVSNVPMMGRQLDDAARRFVNMIDEFYDHSTNIIISSAVVPEKLYDGEKLSFEFARAISRLLEMQSTEYFAKKRIFSSTDH